MPKAASASCCILGPAKYRALPRRTKSLSTPREASPRPPVSCAKSDEYTSPHGKIVEKMAEPKSPVIAIENAGAVTQNGDTWTEIHFTLLDYEGVARYDFDDRPASLDVLFGRDDHDASLSLRKPAKNGQILNLRPLLYRGLLGQPNNSLARHIF